MIACKILIADDEKLAREAIKLQLKNITGIEIVAESNNGYDALQKISALKPDIIFLDIKMPLLTGFEVLEKLPLAYQPYIIIASAFDSFALQAFDHNAIDYLVKPFTDDRFQKAFSKAYDLWQKKGIHAPSVSDRIPGILAAYNKTLNIKDGTYTHIVPYADIIFIEAAKDYVQVHTKERKYLYRNTMLSLEDILTPHGFARIHKSYIVNTNSIKKLDSLYNGDYTVSLHTGHEIKWSRNYRDKLQQFIG